MSQTFWALYGELDDELAVTKSLIKGARCVRENEEDANAETDLLMLAEEKIDLIREVLKEMNEAYRQLEKDLKKLATTEPEKEKVK
jgi:hypothetical protein